MNIQTMSTLNRFGLVFLIKIILIFGGGCVRSAFVDSAYQNCQQGDQVIVNARTFCVYQEKVESRPLDDMDPPNSSSTESSPSSICPASRGDYAK